MAKLKKWKGVTIMKGYGAGGTASGFSMGGNRGGAPQMAVDSLGYGFGSTREARKSPKIVIPPRRRRQMPHYGSKSTRVLEGLDEDLQELLNEVIKFIDISLIEGYRSIERQIELKKLGKTKTLKSKHLTGEAFDFAPYNNGIDWNNRDNFVYTAGIIKGIACQMGIPLRFGGDWNQNNDLTDNNFDDLCHMELDH